MLHNLILTGDGRYRLWEDDTNWEAEGEHDVDDDEWRWSHLNVVNRGALRKLTDCGIVGARHFIDPCEDHEDDDFHSFRNKLITHFKYQWDHYVIEWLA
jgi:hypothetical protein